MKYVITENHFNHYLKLISEQEDFDLNEYDNEDFIEVFFEYFRPWVKSTHGEDVGRYPMSYLLKKYFVEFCKYVGLDVDDDDEYWAERQLVEIGKAFVEKRQHKLPNLRPSVKFTERYSKPINYIIKSLKMPSWMTFNFKETTPYKVEVEIIIDFPKMMISDEKYEEVYEHYSVGPDAYFESFKDQIKTFMGVYFGSPAHGLLDINDYILLKGTEEFTNPTYQKSIKSSIKSVMGGQYIRAIKITTSHQGLRFKLSFDSGLNYWKKNEIRDRVVEKLNSMGFDSEKIYIEI